MTWLYALNVSYFFVSSLVGDDVMSSLKTWTEHKQLKRNKNESIEQLSERDEYLHKTEDKDGDKRGKSCEIKTKRSKHTSTSGVFGATSGLTERFINKGGGPHLSAVEPSELSSHHCPVSQPATAPTFPYLLHFTPEEIAAAPGIEDETFPDMGYTESLSESYSSKMSLRSGPRYPPKSDTREQSGFHEQVMPRTHSLQSLNSSESEPRTPRAKTKPAEVHEFR